MGLDGVELVIAFEEEFGISISDAEVETMVTPRDVINHIFLLKQFDNEGSCSDFKGCSKSQRAFSSIRRAIVNSTGIDKREVQLTSKLSEIFRVKREWRKFQNEVHLGLIMSPFSRMRTFTASNTVEDLVKRLVSRNPTYLNKEGCWTEVEVRNLVRKIIAEQLSVENFSDDDEFVRDLGVG